MTFQDLKYELVPNRNIFIPLSKNYRKRTIDSICHIVDVYEKLSGTKTNTRSKTNGLNDKRLNTDFYYLNTELSDSLYEERDISKIENIISKISSNPVDIYYDDNITIENVSNMSWQNDFIMKTCIDSDSIIKEQVYDKKTVIKPISDDVFSFEKEMAFSSLLEIKNKVPDYYEEIYNNVNKIILFDGNLVTGGTSSRYMSSIFIKKPYHRFRDTLFDPMSLDRLTHKVYYLEQIIHESSHLYLDQVMEFDPLVTNDISQKFKSPIRKDLRPMRGIYHATFVLSRLIDFFMKLGVLDSVNDERSRKERIERINSSLAIGIDEIENKAILTSNGKYILDEMKNKIL
jgi:hypothetical protein